MTTYQQEIVTYRNLYCYLLPVNKAFEAFSHFTYQFILLTEYAIKWRFNCYLLAEIKLHTISILLHTGTYILTYWKEYFYRPLINKGVQAISCFTYPVILLSEYGINKGFYSYLPMKILLLTPEIKLHTDRIFLHTRACIVTYH